MGISWLEPCPQEYPVRHITHAEGGEQHPERNPEGHLGAALLLHHEELGDAGQEQGQRNGGNGQLVDRHDAGLLEIVEAGGPVVAPEKSEQESDGRLVRKAEGVDDRLHVVDQDLE